MRTFVGISCALLLALLANGCIEPYEPKMDDTDMNYLVVDAFLNGSDGLATVKLSRSRPVNTPDPFAPEVGANVYIEDSQAGIHSLTEGNPGQYGGYVANVDVSQTYRLVIQIGDSHEYVSDFTAMVNTPPIDSLTWSVQRDGIRFEVTTHDASGEIRFFKWNFQETHEYYSKLHSAYMFISPGVVDVRPPEMSVSRCWKTNESAEIIVGSSKDLRQAVISKTPITLVPYGSRELLLKYSLLVRQEGLTEESYNYWHSLEKSTENLGGLFDPLPSEVPGNVSCVHHQGERALGLFRASIIREQRMFLRRDQLPAEQSRLFIDGTLCLPDTIFNADLPNQPVETRLGEAVYSLGPQPIGYTSAQPDCLDCTYWGGIPRRPSFWE